MTSFPVAIGVRGRLLSAFLGISAFAVIGAAAALLAFSEVSSVFQGVTRDRVPAAVSALELSRQVERLSSFAPMMLASTRMVPQMKTDSAIRRDIVQLQAQLKKLKDSASDPTLIQEIEGAVAEFRRSLAEIQYRIAAHRCFSGRVDCDFSSLVEENQDLLERNRVAAALLTNAVNKLVEFEQTQISIAEADVTAVQRRSTAILIGVVVLSLIASAFITWFYVGRQIVARLTALSGSMLAVAEGKIDAPLPTSSSRDEIGQMADALKVFRETILENERMRRLKRFLAPQVAELVVSSGDERVLDSHRREVAVLFCDLRGFTSFAETAEPEEVIRMLSEYHKTLGELVHKFSGTLERFTGDGLIVIFNDPLPCQEPSFTAVKLAIEMRRRVADLSKRWHHFDKPLGFGIGIAYGFATLGRIGFEERFEYTAIGSVVNLAARLCERASAGEILIDGKVHAEIAGKLKAEPLGEFTPKGFSRPIKVFNVTDVNT